MANGGSGGAWLSSTPRVLRRSQVIEVVVQGLFCSRLRAEVSQSLRKAMVK